jgi:ADP-ribosylglycohydrolase
MMGLLVGDALGVPYEFTFAGGVPAKDLIEYEPPEGFPKAWPNVPAGTWSDDGAQALCILDALLNGDPNERIETEVAKRLVAWYQDGLWAVDNRVFDIGNTTRQSLHRIINGVPATQAGATGAKTHANGSLMRTLPIAFWKGSDDAVVRAACGQSRVTHAEAIPMLCCAFYCLWARYLAETRHPIQKSWDMAWEALYCVLPKGILTANVQLIQLWKGPPEGSGYCVDSLHSAKLALEVGTDYESTVRHAISLGDDTDTTAAITGGLAGILYEKIPDRWLEGLRSRETLQPLFDQLAVYLQSP